MDTSERRRADREPPDRALRRTYTVAMPDKSGHLIFWTVALLGFALDVSTKWAVFAWLADKPEQRAELIRGFLTFRAALNTGAAFGIASGMQALLAAVSVFALVAIIGVFLFGRMRQRIMQVALGLFAGGVCGNLWDRLFNDGQVRDFIDVVYWPGRHWHTFNVADAMLCIAVGLLVIATVFTDSSCQRRGRPQR